MAIPDEEMEPGAALSEAARNAGILDVPESSLFAGTDSNPQHLRVPSSANAFTPSVETGFDLVTTFIYTLGACSLAWVGLLLRPRTKSAQKFRHR